MFYIYSSTGRNFAGPLEQLRRVEKTEQTAAIRAIEGSNEERPSSQEEFSKYVVSERAVTEYQSMLKKASVQEAVYHAHQIMSQPVVSIREDASIEEAHALFEKVRYQAIPIMGKQNQLVAMLARSRLYRTLLSETKGHIAEDAWVIDLIPENERQVISADPVTDVRRIAQVLVEHRLDAMPIVEQSHRLVGIVSRTDILKCVTADPPLSLWC